MKRKLLPILVFVLCFLHANAEESFPFDVKVSGHGPKSLILIPGLTCPGDVWNETIEHYKKDYTCYTLTFHGFAGAPADSSANYRNWETSVARYIMAKKISNPTIIGHSIGGGLALLLAADYPEIISKIVVVDALPCLMAIRNPTFVANPQPDCSSMVARYQSISDDEFYKMQKQTALSMMTTDTARAEELIRWSVKSDRKTMGQIYCQFINTDMRGEIARVKCPTLVLLEAPFANVKTAVADQYKNLKHARLEYANKGLHFIMYDDTEWYFKTIDEYLK